MPRDTHSLAIGYILWIFGFLGAHRFYYGRPISGTIYFFTFGLFLIGWLVDLILMPKLDYEADQVFTPGHINYSVAWLLFVCLGIFGVHRFYMGKWGMALIYLFTCGFFLIGIIYDFWTLNDKISRENTREADYPAYR